LARKDDVTVLFTDLATADDLRPTAWHRKTGDDWTASHDVTVGVLPDTNVGKLDEQHIRQVAQWRGWFVAAGSSTAGGGVWLSQDAAHWERVPVKTNGFGEVGSLSLLTNGATVLVVGNTSSGDGPLKVWKSA
jgi:hypothetical protein